MQHKKSMHRILICRLAIAAISLALILSIVVVSLEFSSIYERVSERSLSSVEHLRWLMLENLGANGFTDRAKIKNIMQKLAAESIKSADGAFVYTRILDLNFAEVAYLRNDKYNNINAVVEFASKNMDRPSLVYHGRWHKMQLIGEDTVIYLGTELKNSANVRVGYIDGIYVIAPAFIAQAKWSAVVTGLSVIGIVLLTTLILYPIIVRLFRKVTALSSSLLDANMEILNTLGNVIAKNDSKTDIHNYRVTIYAVRTAEVLQLDGDSVRALIKGAFLHDVGKIGVRDGILLKPGKLTAEEFAQMQKHVASGVDIVTKSSWLADAAPMVNFHHEKYNGSGYASQLQEESIPKIARVFAIADVFDALTSERPYKKPLGFEATIEILETSRGTHFDPEVLEAFLSVARSLYDEYANRDDAQVREDMRKLVMRYFTAEVVDAI